MPTVKLSPAELDATLARLRAQGVPIGQSVAERFGSAGYNRLDAKKCPHYKPVAAGEMNPIERNYADRLDILIRTGEVRSWKFEPRTFLLAPNANCSYRPDFLVIREDGSTEYHEVKGKHVHQESAIKLKWASELFAHEARFYLARARWDKETSIFHWRIIRIGGTPDTHRKEWK